MKTLLKMTHTSLKTATAAVGVLLARPTRLGRRCCLQQTTAGAREATREEKPGAKVGIKSTPPMQLQLQLVVQLLGSRSLGAFASGPCLTKQACGRGRSRCSSWLTGRLIEITSCSTFGSSAFGFRIALVSLNSQALTQVASQIPGATWGKWGPTPPSHHR